MEGSLICESAPPDGPEARSHVAQPRDWAGRRSAHWNVTDRASEKLLVLPMSRNQYWKL